MLFHLGSNGKKRMFSFLLIFVYLTLKFKDIIVSNKDIKKDKGTRKDENLHKEN